MMRFHSDPLKLASRALGTLLLSIVIFSCAATASEDWKKEQWTIENFTNVVGGGPQIGPASEAGGGVNALCGDAQGNIYVLAGNTVFIITKDGMKRRLAGTGGSGHKDGPANLAKFNQGSSYNVCRSIQCDGQGNIILADNGNKCIRRIFKKDGKWMVDTWAGGGKRKLKTGESCKPLEANLIANIGAVAAPDGTVTIGGAWGGIFRVTADGTKITKLGHWPTTVGSSVTLVMADGDRLGNSYFVSRAGRTDSVVKVDKEGKITHIAGLSVTKLKAEKKGHKKPHHIGDGPPLNIYIDTPTSIVAKPNGSCVYTCGGDEYDIRRIPTDLKSTSSTLLRNGRWYVMPVHPNKNRPRKGFGLDPTLTGKSKPEGGKLSNLANCHLCGKDYQGNMYGFLYSWCGETQSISGKGPLQTKVYRIRRVTE